MRRYLQSMACYIASNITRFSPARLGNLADCSRLERYSCASRTSPICSSQAQEGAKTIFLGSFHHLGKQISIQHFLENKILSLSSLSGEVGGIPGRLLKLPGTRAGGGPRTFPGGVNKWKWKRMQEKKARGLEKMRLTKEREAFEARRREQLRLTAGPERPWEGDLPRRLPGPGAASSYMAPVPEVVTSRFKRKGAEDLWNEEDGPSHFTRPDGKPSARSLPSDANFSTASYQRVSGNLKPASTARRDGIQGRTARERIPGDVRGPTKGPHPGSKAGISGSRSLSSGSLSQQGAPRKLASANLRPVETHSAPVLSAASQDIDAPSTVNKAFMSNTRFDSFPLSHKSIQALHEGLGYTDCTEVQAATLPPILAGVDVLAKAKTGTGKTIAFLLPAIETILREEAKGGQGGGNHSQVRVLVICPARELASQVAKEAKMLLQFHEGLGAQLVIGGTRIPAEAKRLQHNPCQVLVGTPGRLLDHIQNSPGVRQQLQGLQVFVLDEADQLLDMGFKKTLDSIRGFLPKKRQTLLFSATIPPEVKSMASASLRPDHKFVDTVGEEEKETNVQVLQESAIVPMDKQLVAVYALLQEHIRSEPNYKVLVFSTTARMTGLMAELFQVLGINSLEIHSRKSQPYRTKVSDQFRQGNQLVMFTSDVSARGVDYPNVTLVLQVGIPSDRAQYVHRLGRTGRAGKEGRGVLLLAPWEKFFLNNLTDLPISPTTLPPFDPSLSSKLALALSKVEVSTRERAYQAWLGYYNSVKGLKWDKATLVLHANDYSAIIGLPQPPAIMKKTIGMMGLRGVPGLRVA